MFRCMLVPYVILIDITADDHAGPYIFVIYTQLWLYMCFTYLYCIFDCFRSPVSYVYIDTCW